MKTGIHRCDLHCMQHQGVYPICNTGRNKHTSTRNGLVSREPGLDLRSKVTTARIRKCLCVQTWSDQGQGWQIHDGRALPDISVRYNSAVKQQIQRYRPHCRQCLSCVVNGIHETSETASHVLFTACSSMNCDRNTLQRIPYHPSLLHWKHQDWI